MDNEPKKLTRRARAMLGNTHAARNPTKSFLKRRLILNPEDNGAYQAGVALGKALLEDKADPTAGEVALAESAALSRTLALLAISEMARCRESDPARASAFRAETAKHLANGDRAVIALGLKRREVPQLDVKAILKGE